MSLLSKVHSAAASLKTALVIMACVGVVALLGTFIPQEAEKAKVIDAISPLFGSSADAAYHALDAIGFTDLYHSPLFVALLGLFALNLTLCTIRAMKAILKTMAAGVREPSLTDAAESAVLKDADAGAEYLKKTASRLGWRLHTVRTGVFVLEKWRISRFGFVVLHAGLLVILAGGLIGAVWGVKGAVSILEGTEDNVIILKEGGEKKQLDFSLYIDDFEVDFYPRTDTAKSYRTRINVMENGQKVHSWVLDVNHPLHWKGYSFYPASFGFLGNNKAEFRLTFSANGVTENAAVHFMEKFAIPGTDLTGVVADFAPALASNDQGQLYNYSENMFNPAILLEVYRGEEAQYRAWVMSRKPESGNMPDFTVAFNDAWGMQYSVMTVKNDPGVPVVYFGFFLLMAGLVMIFCLNHVQVPVIIETAGGKAVLRWELKKQRKASLLDQTGALVKALRSATDIMKG